MLDVPFAMRAVASASGARWDAEHGVFVARAETLPPALAPFRAAPYSWERRIERELNDDPAPAPAAPAGAIVLRPHQLDGVRAIAAAKAERRAGFLLADDVGLGKTITAWAAVLRMPDVATVLIVCPLAVVAHWRRTVQAMGDAGKEIVI
ncbi:SNF2-related protein, partial [Aeromonas sp. EERV15]|uniref:SNF2-related protein n=1 Tax=Aeromonas sp. EERV15 TaxID=1833892 RepID=UPI001C401304